MRYGAMAACAVALVGIGAAMVNSSRFKAEAPAEAAMTEECVEGSAPAEEAPAEAAPAEEPMMAEAQETADTAATEARRRKAQTIRASKARRLLPAEPA